MGKNQGIKPTQMWRYDQFNKRWVPYTGSTDEEGQVQVEIRGFDAYQLNHIDDGNTTANVTYLGAQDQDAKYAITKIDETTAPLPLFTYATIKNNAATTDYSTAWTNRATLTYGLYSQAF